MALGAVWAREQWGRAWSNDPRELGTLIPVFWFAAMTVLWRVAPRKQHLCVLLGIVGIGVSIGGWFVPALFSLTHAYGYGTTYLYLFAGLGLPMAIAMLGMLPPGRLRRQTP
jgi:hypothetical protein